MTLLFIYHRKVQENQSEYKVGYEVVKIPNPDTFLIDIEDRILHVRGKEDDITFDEECFSEYSRVEVYIVNGRKVKILEIKDGNWIVFDDDLLYVLTKNF